MTRGINTKKPATKLFIVTKINRRPIQKPKPINKKALVEGTTPT